MRFQLASILIAVTLVIGVAAAYIPALNSPRIIPLTETTTVSNPTATETSTVTFTTVSVSTTASTTTIYLKQQAPYATMISQRNLRVELWLNASAILKGGSLRIEMNLSNTLSQTNTVPVSQDWPLPQVVAPPYYNPCPSPYPIGIAVYSGYYTQTNVTSGRALMLYEPGTTFCNEGFSFQSYDFKPLSNIAVLPSNYTTTLAVHAVTSINGSWYTGPAPQYTPQFEKFSPGAYTLVECDEWGDALFLYFTVQ